MSNMKVILNAVTRSITPMSIEEYIIHEARVSNPSNRLNHETAPKLLKHLIDSRHWSPFEMVAFNFEVETSRAISQQIIRHRSFSFQEYSQRYSEVEGIQPIELRYQAEKNRQSSTDVCDGYVLNEMVNRTIIELQEVYQELISAGIARECARMILPLATTTTIVMHGTLRSWIHFLDQRCNDHAQKEIRLIALEIRRQLSELCPWTATALNWIESDEEREEMTVQLPGELTLEQLIICEYAGQQTADLVKCNHKDSPNLLGLCNPSLCPKYKK